MTPAIPSRVALLPPDVARRIAAGEVIERPASVIRELIDNSLDAGADDIDVRWAGGGIEHMRVSDNGRGMSRADLELCWQPHATSKIRTLEDLQRCRTLGFRGEALASVAAVSELVVSTTATDGSDDGASERTGSRLVVREAHLETVEPAPPAVGTRVDVRGLFANVPARRRFLSRAQAESSAIRTAIGEKALARPDVRFSFASEPTGGASGSSPGGARVTVYPVQTLVERVAAVYGDGVPAARVHQLEASGASFRVTVVAAEPEVTRRDRRLMQAYVNGRRIWEYRLIHAVDYAYQDVLHGGLFPAAAVFVELDPDLVDFNIHPAKREARIRPIDEIHHRIVEVLRGWLRAWAVKAARFDAESLTESLWPEHGAVDRRVPTPGAPEWRPTSPAGGAGTPQRHAAERPPRLTPSSSAPSAATPRPERFRHDVKAVPDATDGHAVPQELAAEAADAADLAYHGTLFETFVIVSFRNRAWLIDQHAAHERLLYNRFAAARSSQPLLVPERFEVSDDEAARLERLRGQYAQLGIQVEPAPEAGVWLLTALPPEYRGRIEPIIESVRDGGLLNEEYDRDILAEIACKAAVKAGDYLDGLSALDLARRTLALAVPRCPHGRPLWIELTRERLEELIGRR